MRHSPGRLQRVVAFGALLRGESEPAAATQYARNTAEDAFQRADVDEHIGRDRYVVRRRRRVARAALLLEEVTEVRIGLREVGIERECPPERALGVAMAPDELQRRAAIVVRAGVARLQVQRCVERGDRIGGTSGVDEHQRKAEVHERSFGIADAARFEQRVAVLAQAPRFLRKGVAQRNLKGQGSRAIGRRRFRPRAAPPSTRARRTARLRVPGYQPAAAAPDSVRRP